MRENGAVSVEQKDRRPDTRLLVGLLGDAATTTPATVAERLGVSRDAAAATLECLAREGVVEPAGGSAFRSAGLDVAELRELYPAVLLLESVAVRHCPPFDEDTLERLRAANAELRAAADDPAAAIAADDDFHRALTEDCGNDRLLTVLRPVRRALLRYERAYMIDAERIERSAVEHDTIIAALAAHDQETAAQRVRENYTRALPDLEAQLERDGGR